MGKSCMSGNDVLSSPIMYGVGAHTISIIFLGNTGMYVCCHSNGYNNADMAWMQLDKVLKSKQNLNSK